MELTSTAFANIESIPSRYSGEGADVSPPLLWSDLPTGTTWLALLCEDPDAPRHPGRNGPFVHWVIYNFLPSAGMLPEGIPQGAWMDEPLACEQGRNSFGRLGYNGPLPPSGHGMHRYFFRLLALSDRLRLSPGAGRDELLRGSEGKVLGRAALLGTYERGREERAG